MKLSITAKIRKDVKKKNKQIKNSGKVLGVLFGGSLKESIPVSFDKKEISIIFNNAKYHQIVTVAVDKKEYKAIIREVQFANISHDIIHVSFWVIEGAKEISTLVPIELTGTSEAVSTSIGILVTPITSIMIRCNPIYLPENLLVPIDSLAEVGDKITIGKIKLPENVFLAYGIDPKQQVVSIAPFQKMIEVETVEEETDEKGSDETDDESTKKDDDSEEKNETKKEGDK